MNLQQRTVHGYDLIVTFVEENDKVLVTKVYGWQGNRGRFSLPLINSAVGYRVGRGAMHFLKNNNLHDSCQGMRGVLVMIDYKVGLIVRSIGSHVIFQVLLPRRLSGQILLINLVDDEGHHGFYLQQIHGRLVSRTTPRLRQRHKPYPYLIGGNLYMDPAGPDVCTPMRLSDVPISIKERFVRLQDNFCTRTAITSSRIGNARRANICNTLYVVDTTSRADLGKSGNMFYIPFGEPYDRVLSPWEGDESNRKE